MSLFHHESSTINRKLHLSALLLPLSLLTVTGCDVQKIAGMTGGATKLSGPHAAIGGLNYQDAPTTSADWHITTCSQQFATHALTFGTGSQADLLTLQAAAPAQLTLRASQSQPIHFSAEDCTVLKLDLAPRSDHPEESDGKLSIVCRRGSETLNGSIRFERCRP